MENHVSRKDKMQDKNDDENNISLLENLNITNNRSKQLFKKCKEEILEKTQVFWGKNEWVWWTEEIP